MGYAFAQSSVICYVTQEEALMFAQRSAQQNERDGYWAVATMRCERPIVLENFLKSASLGCVNSMLQYAIHSRDKEPQKWYWLARFGLATQSRNFLVEFSGVVIRFQTHCIYAESVFMIGRMLKHFTVNPTDLYWAQKAMLFTKQQCKAARDAVDTWSFVALRIGNHIINRDMRKMIGLLIWNARELAEYPNCL